MMLGPQIRWIIKFHAKHGPILALSVLFGGFLIGIFLKSRIFIDPKTFSQTWYWTFSTIFQGFTALIALLAIFIVYFIQTLDRKIEEQYRSGRNPDPFKELKKKSVGQSYPTMILLGCVIILSLYFLPIIHTRDETLNWLRPFDLWPITLTIGLAVYGIIVTVITIGKFLEEGKKI